MIPDRLPPNLAPGGLVVVAFDLDGNEVTRTIQTPDRANMLEALALDAGMEVGRRGGGSMVAYDGDTGDLYFRGPVIRENEPTMHEYESLAQLFRAEREAVGLSWTIMGIFSTESTEQPGAWWNDFCYTVGLGPVELHVPCASIEGRFAGAQITGSILNLIACGFKAGIIAPGDSVRVPLGIPGGDDQDSIWWIGQPDLDVDRYQCNMASPIIVLPIRWSSPLGWREDDCPAGGPHVYETVTAWEAGPGPDRGGTRCAECGHPAPPRDPDDYPGP